MNKNRDVVRAGYRLIAGDYHAGRLDKEAANIDWLDTLRPWLPPNGRVVDLGCGSGVPITRYFADRGYDVAGYDLSEEMLGIARRVVPEANFTVAAIEDLQLESASVDLIVSFFAIIHIDRALHARIFESMFAWLRDGGSVFLSLGAEDNPNQQSGDWYGAPMAWSHFDAKTNLNALENAGFLVIWHEVEDFGNEKHLFVIAKKPEG